MAEVFGWPEGRVYYWTGTATASGEPGYFEAASFSLTYGYSNYRTMDSAYHDTLTGQRADVTIGSMWSTNALLAIADARTAVHLHFVASGSTNGTAGIYLYSGRIDRLELQGQNNDVYRQSVTYHANVWSAYG
jgi:hypothetical protein